MKRATRVAGWLYDRAGIAPLHRFIREHKIPPGVGRTRKGWFYVFGPALLFVFLLQVVTGTALALHYIPSPVHAWDSLQHLNAEVAWGGFVRGLHFFGASAMVVLVFAHMARVFLTGSYKYPRELNWISGVVLLYLVMAMAFTGQLLRWDEDGVSTVAVAASIAARTPVLGEPLRELILRGDSIGGGTLTAFYALHVIVLPLLIFAVIGIHIYLVLRNGVSEPPEAGRPVDPRTYRSWYRKHRTEGGSTYWPDAAGREMIFVAVVYTIIFVSALVFGPQGPGPPPDPAALEAIPDPDWFFLWYYSLIWYKPPVLDELVLLWLPLLLVPVLLALPVAFGAGERAPSRRPWAVFLVAGSFTIWLTLTAVGMRPYWVPDFETRPPDAAVVAEAPPDARLGSQVFFQRGCQYCHAVLGSGGSYGPDLTRTALRLPPEEITVRIIMGIGNMPAYQGVLSTQEIEVMLAYLRWAAEAAETDGIGGR